jgi:hypothetical protein
VGHLKGKMNFNTIERTGERRCIYYEMTGYMLQDYYTMLSDIKIALQMDINSF